MALKKHSRNPAVLPMGKASIASPRIIIIAAETVLEVDHVLMTLPISPSPEVEQARTILWAALRKFGGVTVKEIIAHYGLEIWAVKSQLWQMNKQLKNKRTLPFNQELYDTLEQIRKVAAMLQRAERRAAPKPPPKRRGEMLLDYRERIAGWVKANTPPKW